MDSSSLSTPGFARDHVLLFDDTSTIATRALAEFDLSPSDRKAAVRLLVSTLGSGTEVEVQSTQVKAVLRAIDCEFVARRIRNAPIMSQV